MSVKTMMELVFCTTDLLQLRRVGFTRPFPGLLPWVDGGGVLRGACPAPDPTQCLGPCPGLPAAPALLWAQLTCEMQNGEPTGLPGHGEAAGFIFRT